MTDKMKILISIDPSSTSTGWAIFQYDDKGCELMTSGQWNLVKGNKILEDRIESLFDNINGLCFEWSPDKAVYENPDIFTNPKYRDTKTQIAYRKAVDACKSALWGAIGMEHCHGVTVQEWKNTKSKGCTIAEVNSEWRLKLTMKENDQADSVGLGDAFLQRLGTPREYKSDRQIAITK